tara:strand:- start:2742 stop:3620 length:879 start_codon:yes stop_codon:yes gene_type:complete
MAFEFRDILPAVGAVIGFGFGGPGGAALGSGIGSLARGDEADEAFKNALLGYAGGQGARYLGGTQLGKSFLGALPTGASEFLSGGMDKDIFGTAIGKGKEFLGMDKGNAYEQVMSNYDSQYQAIMNSDASDEAKTVAVDLLKKNVSSGLNPEESLLNMRNILGLTTFAGLFGNILDQGNKGGPSYEDFKVTTDTAYEGFDKPPPIKDVSGFANGGIVSLAEGGFPRKNGKIEGPGTETSDDIPAMLSDGEFVVNARTVRGLGESMGAKDDADARERGSSFLYSLQDKYGGKA